MSRAIFISIHIAFLLHFCGSSVFARDEGSVAWNAIKSGVEKNLEGLEFRCEFVLQRGFAVSAEDALAGRFVGLDLQPASQVETGMGVYVKMGSHIRFRYQTDTPTDLSAGGGGTSLISTDTSMGDGWRLSYTPKQLNTEGVQVGGQVSLISCSHSGGWWLEDAGSPFQSYSPPQQYGSTIEVISEHKIYAANEKQPDVFRMTSHRDGEYIFGDPPEAGAEGQPGSTFTYLMVDTSHHFPRFTKFQNGGMQIHFSDYVELPGGYSIPKVCRNSVGPIKVAGSKHEFYVGRIWIATKLAPPSVDDFEIVWTESDIIRGFETEPGVHSLNLAKIDKARFVVDRSMVDRPLPPQTPVPEDSSLEASSADYRWPLRVLSIGLFVAGCLFFFFKIWRR